MVALALPLERADNSAFTFPGDLPMRLPANTSATVEVTFINANGLAVETQGEVTWSSSDESVATVEADPDDPTMATITAGPSAGNTNVSAVADADLGEGVRNVEAVLEVVVIARGEAVGGEITPVGISIPGGGEQPDNTLPGGSGGTPDQGLPTRPGRPVDPDFSRGVVGGGPRPDAGAPEDQPEVGNELPGQPSRPGQGLPETPDPK
jgi:hypothetical protein